MAEKPGPQPKEQRPGISRNTWIIVVVCCLLYLVVCVDHFNSIMDDSYIGYRYAHNFSRGYGLTYNKAKKPVEGYSNFTWVVMLAGLHRLGADIPLAAKALGILSGLAILVLLPFVMRRVCEQEEKPCRALWLAPFLLCPMAPFIFWSVNGLETVFYAFLVTVAVYLRMGELSDKKGFPFSGLVFAAAALSRPEGVIFFAAAAMFILGLWKFQRRKPTAKDIVWVVLFAVPFLLHLFWRYSYYGYWLPNTYYAKATGRSQTEFLGDGVNYMVLFVSDFGYSLLVCSVGFVVLTFRRVTVNKLFLLVVVTVNVLFILKVGGDWMSTSRFMVPVLPVLCIITAFVLERLGTPLISSARIPAWLIVVLFMCFMAEFHLCKTEHAYKTKWRPFQRGLTKAHGVIGKWLKENCSREETVVVIDAGVIPYVSDMQVIELAGLTNEYFAHLPGRFLGDKFDAEWVLRQEPDYIVLTTSAPVQGPECTVKGLFPVQAAIGSHPEFKANYTFIIEREFWKNHWVTLWRRTPATNRQVGDNSKDR